MRIVTDKEKIIIYGPEFFDIKDILECGQVFRYVKNGEGDYTVLSSDKRARVYGGDGKVVIDCGQEKDAPYFYNYFDLDTDYGMITENILRLSSDNPGERDFMRAAADYGKGIRILKQDKIETIISFIISANNNIRRIQAIIERLCLAAGEDMGGYRAFPGLPALAKLDENFYNSIGAGYRAAYLCKTARALNDGFDIGAVGRADRETAEKLLTGLYGVGPKVANCIMLFGFAETGAFPVDTWIEKAFNSFYGGGYSRAQIQKRLTAKYGDFSGYAQQYIFYYARGTRVALRKTL